MGTIQRVFGLGYRFALLCPTGTSSLPFMAALELLGLTGLEFQEAAKARLPSGFGLASTIYRDLMATGSFRPEGHGLSEVSVAAYHQEFKLTLPEVVNQTSEGSEHGEDTVKAVLRYEDGLEAECVRIPMGHDRFTLCVSSQMGCKMACAFCETARMGLIRQLSAAEIVAQLVVARSVLGWKIRNIVFMGMGEPLDNADAVVQALRVMHDRRGLSYGQPRLTVCTAGRPDGLEKLAALGYRRMDLSLSLNAATDKKRDKLMPVNRRYPLATLQQALLKWPRRKGFVFAINYCLMPGFNDSREDARDVAKFCEPLDRALLNLIPYNPGNKPLTRAPTEEEIDTFIGWLSEEGVPVRRRRTRGRSVMAACGQLGNRELRKRLPVVTEPS